MFKVNNHKRHSILVRFAAYMALTLFALGMNELRSVQKAISYQ